jgi:hypothetical protein
MLGRLEEHAAVGTQIADVEDQLVLDVCEVGRLGLQKFLDDRAASEARREVTGSDAVARTRVEHDHTRPLRSVFGEVTVTRWAYRAGPVLPGRHGEQAESVTQAPVMPESDATPGQRPTRAPDRRAGNLYPADAQLNLPVGKDSWGLARLVAAEAARGSYEEATAAVYRASGQRIGKRQAEQIAAAAAVDADAYYAAHRPEPCPGKVLMLQADGKGIVMRPQDLRPGTAAAAATRPGGLSPHPGHGRKRMSEVVAVADVTSAVRAPADILPTGTRRHRPRPPAPTTTGTWVNASITDDIPAMISAMIAEAERRDPAHARTWIALIDGNNQQIDEITAQARKRGITITTLIDFVHVMGYLHAAARALHQDGDPAASTWAHDLGRTILTGRPVDAIATIRHRIATVQPTPAHRAKAEEAITYLTNKQPHLDYPTALAKGWPIATGLIEGTCRWMIKDRMDITGARWSLPGAEAILKLRALKANGDFETYWAWHLQQELQRNHLSRYHELDLAA